jgi:hypothetical protein
MGILLLRAQGRADVLPCRALLSGFRDKLLLVRAQTSLERTA